MTKTDPYGFYAPMPKVGVHVAIDQDTNEIYLCPLGPDDPYPSDPNIAIDADLWRSYLAHRDQVMLWHRLLKVLLERQDRELMLAMQEAEQKEQDES